MGKIIVFTNVKGGVGKTLMCSYFASYLTQKGRRVAVVDADIQQSLSDHREDDLQRTSLTVPITRHGSSSRRGQASGSLSYTVPRPSVSWPMKPLTDGWTQETYWIIDN